jgi:hypothetical protein
MNMYITPDQNTVVLWADENTPRRLAFAEGARCPSCALYGRPQPVSTECAGSRRPGCCPLLGRNNHQVGIWRSMT